MNRHPDDGYAFAVSTIDGFTQHGLTKREAFAMAAMQGLCSNYRFMESCGSALSAMGIEHASNDHALGVRRLVATAAIGTADALLAKLAKDGQP